MKRIMTTMAMLALGVSSIVAQSPDRYNFNRGYDALANGDMQEAQSYLLRDIEENPKDGYSPALMTWIYHEQSRYGNALQMANKALKYLPSNDMSFHAWALEQRGKVYLCLGDTARALSDYESAIVESMFDERLIGIHGQLSEQLGRFEEAENDFKILVDSETPEWHIDGLMELARLKTNQGQYAAAIEYANQLIEYAPDLDYGYGRRARARFYLKDYDNAIADIIIALSINMDNYNQSLLAPLAAEAYEPLVRALEGKANAESGELHAIWTTLVGWAHQTHGAYAKAIEAYTASQSERPSGAAMYHLATCYEGLGQYDKALESIDEVLALSPDKYGHLVDKARYYYESGKPAEAIGVLDQLINEHPEFSNLYYAFHLRGWYKKMMGDIDGAIEDITISMAIYPEYAYNYLTRGEMYKTLGQTKESEADLRKGIELDDKGKDAEITYYCYFYLGDNRKAIEALEPTLTVDDKSNYYDAACLYSLMGNTNKSLRYLRRAFELGYKRFAHIRRDDDLKNLRATKGFEKLMKEYEEK